MKTACVITVGNELVSGDSVDTNSAWIGSELTRLNIPVKCIFSVGDDVDIISETLETAAQLSDIVIVTGGLGPTDDDITRNAIAKFMGEKLVFNQENWEKIQLIFKSRNYPIPEKNRVQAYYPESAEIIDNKFGTACGISVKHNDTAIYALPGPPSEMKNMFKSSIEAKIENTNSGNTIYSRKLHIIGMGESAVAEKLDDMMKRGRNPLINCTFHMGIITLHVIAEAENSKSVQDIVNKDVRVIEDILGNAVFAKDHQTLPQSVGQLLREKQKTVSLAESCTGGLIAKMLTDNSGSSEYFTHGWVTYSNDAKISQLSVDAEIIEKYGAVSEETARQMAIGAKIISGSDYSIAVTGIAGPSGGNEQKPVGLVYIALYDGKNCDVHKYNFSRTREFVRFRTAQTALNLLRLKIGV